jgi:hypothetical protein
VRFISLVKVFTFFLLEEESRLKINLALNPKRFVCWMLHLYCKQHWQIQRSSLMEFYPPARPDLQIRIHHEHVGRFQFSSLTMNIADGPISFFLLM